MKQAVTQNRRLSLAEFGNDFSMGSFNFKGELEEFAQRGKNSERKEALTRARRSMAMIVMILNLNYERGVVI